MEEMVPMTNNIKKLRIKLVDSILGRGDDKIICAAEPALFDADKYEFLTA